MTFADNGGVKIYFEEAGAGVPLVFLHEYLNDHTGWDGQMRRFSRDYRCIAIAARGYPPSDAPDDESAYSQDLFKADVLAVLDHLEIGRAHIVGLSMGAYTGLQLAIENPDRVLSVIAASGGSGGYEPGRAAFEQQTAEAAVHLDAMETMPAEALALGPTRVQLQRKDPISWARVVEIIGRRTTKSAAMTMRQVQLARTPVFRLEKELRALTTPVLLMAGDEDESCLDVNLWLKRTMASARLAVFPACGHVLHLEEPELFNHLSGQFLSSVDRDSWYPRDPSTMPVVSSATAVGLGKS